MENKILCKSCLNFIPIISWWCKEEKAVEYHGRRCSSIHGGCTKCPFYIRISFDYLKGIRWLIADDIRKSYLRRLTRRERERISQSFKYYSVYEKIKDWDYYTLRVHRTEYQYKKKPKPTLRRRINKIKRKWERWRDDNIKF